MTQYDFEKLLEKYLRNECTEEEELLLNEWAKLQMAEPATTQPATEITVLKRRLWKRIQKNTVSPKRTFSFARFPWSIISVAASVVLILAWFGRGVYMKNFDGSTDQILQKKNVQMVHTAEKRQKILLSDGTLVLLQPHSSITFPEKFGQKERLIYLNGEAMFEVSRDTSRPFRVYAGNLVTEVLGTSFTVKSYQNDLTSEVIVWSGKVRVYNSTPGNSVRNSDKRKKTPLSQAVLTPNQKVIFEKVSEDLKVSLVEKPLQLNPVETQDIFTFNEEPLFNVLDKLEYTYGIDIEPSEALKDCAFTGDLNGFDLYTQLDWICKTINASYETRDGRVLIKGKSCL